MGTQLVLPIGTNPLPVWVAWHHLCHKLHRPVYARLVHTQDTRAEKTRLANICQGEFLAPIETSAGEPAAIRRDIQAGIQRGLPPGISEAHIHYTGGTKAMAVETVVAATLAAGQDNIQSVETSYLDPRANSGPAIVRQSGDPWVTDARKNINADLERIAQLNGFEISRIPDRPTPEKLESSLSKLRTYQAGQSNLGRDGTWLELAAYAAFSQALENISNSNKTRRNYKLFHSVHVQRRRDNRTLNPFELDVVAVLGYQIVVVSCSTSTGTANDPNSRSRKRRELKLKAMEAIFRTRQLGGDEARAVLLCRADSKTAREIQEELEDEMGSTDTPLQVWGKSQLDNYPAKAFHKYLQKDLLWQ